jgi:hypothetical protein
MFANAAYEWKGFSSERTVTLLPFSFADSALGNILSRADLYLKTRRIIEDSE